MTEDGVRPRDIAVDDPRSKEILGLGWSSAAQFARMLEDEGELRGLIGPRELPRLWSRHVLNSAAVAAFLPARGSVADVGTGAGLPGVVLATMRSDLEFHLIEPMQRRVDWLGEVCAELDLDNVSVHRARAEELHGSVKTDVVTARAVAGLSKLVPMCLPLVRGGGALLAQKGKRAQDEVEAARKHMRRAGVVSVEVHEVDVVGDGEITRVVEARKGR